MDADPSSDAPSPEAPSPDAMVHEARERRVLLNEMLACRPGRRERCERCGAATCDPEADRWWYTLDAAGFVGWCAPCAERELGRRS